MRETEPAPRGWRKNIAIALSVISLGCAGGLYEVQKSSSARSDTNACVLKAALNKIVDRIEVIPSKDPKATKEAVKFYTDLSNGLQPKWSECKGKLK